MFEDVQSWVGDDDDDDEAAKADVLQDSKADNELMPVDGNAEELFKSEDELSHDESNSFATLVSCETAQCGSPKESHHEALIHVNSATTLISP